MPATSRGHDDQPGPGGRRLMNRADRRAALITAATRAFARNGFAATSLDDIAAEAGVARDTIYRNFDTKAALYQAALDDIEAQLDQEVAGRIEYDSISTLLHVAQRNPDGFRLLFRHAAREPRFRARADQRREAISAGAARTLRRAIADPARLKWAAALVPATTIEAIISWLDAGCPEPGHAAETISAFLDSIVGALRGDPLR